jgi:hypothetical protein
MLDWQPERPAADHSPPAQQSAFSGGSSSNSEGISHTSGGRLSSLLVHGCQPGNLKGLMLVNLHLHSSVFLVGVAAVVLGEAAAVVLGEAAAVVGVAAALVVRVAAVVVGAAAMAFLLQNGCNLTLSHEGGIGIKT